MKPMAFMASAMCIAGICLLSGCQKEAVDNSDSVENALAGKAKSNKNELHEYSIMGSFDVWYKLIPDMENGWNPGSPLAPAWYPGAGEGHLNHLGKSMVIFNQYARVAGQTVAAPVQQFFTSILQEYASELNERGIQIPSDAGTVAIVFYDKQGNAIWGRGVGAGIYTMVSPTRLEGIGKAEITGGTGKFANASGHCSFKAYFNPQDEQDAGIEVYEGTIVY